jgi:threonine dehydratase
VLATPYSRCRALSAVTGAEVWVKAEHLQLTGSFKVRGAFNKLLRLSRDERRQGIIAASSGNHGAAVAHAAKALGLTARIFVPETAAAGKVEKIRRAEAEVVHHGTDGLDTEIEARRRAMSSNTTYVSPYNDVDVVTGQGTVALEMVRQGPALDRVYVAVGGGGLIGGMATLLREKMPGVRIIGALPRNSAVMVESVLAGRIIELESLPTLSDGTAGGIEADSITFDICRTLVNAWSVVSEAEIASAMRVWGRTHDSVIEGAAGVALAALLRDAPSLTGQRAAVVICGGNASRDQWVKVLSEE